MNFLQIKEDVYSLLSTVSINVTEGDLGLEENGISLDFLKNIYVTYDLDTISDGVYKNNIVLEIQVISNIKNKTLVQAKCVDIDVAIDRVETRTGRIVKVNPWFIPVTDEGKYYATLQYYIVDYKS